MRRGGGDRNFKLMKPRLLSWPQIKWVFSLSLREVPLLGLGAVALLLTSISGLSIPFLVGKMIDTVMKSDDKKGLGIAVIILAVMMLFNAVFTVVRTISFSLAAERIVAHLRRKLFHHIIIQDIEYFDEKSTGDLTNRLSSDTKALENAVTVNLSMLARHVVQGIGAVILLFYLSWLLTVVILGIIPVLVVMSVIYGKFVRRFAKRFQDSLADAGSVAQEAISNIKTVRSFAREQYQESLYNKKIDKSYSMARTLALLRGSFIGAAALAGNVAIIIIVCVGGYLVMTKNLSIGELTSFLMYTVYLAMSLGMITSLYYDFVKALGATVDIFQIIQRIPHINCIDNPDTDLPVQELDGDIKFHNVSFSYPTRPDDVVLDNLNLTLEKGNVVAVVGESGQGKTTISSLVQRFYDVDSGHITIGDHDLRDLPPSVLHSNIGTVSQESSLFGTTIEENIKFGNLSASHDDIVESAKKANAHEFITGFSDGYETKLGERGKQLSGGQAQRINLARAIILDAPFLILDESTSSLDSKNEKIIQESLDKLMVGRTVLVIAHRLSTIKAADKICVLNGGKIVEEGKHDELIALGGHYKQLVEAQLFK